MSEYRINKVLFKILNPNIKIWLSDDQQPGFHKKSIQVFRNITLPGKLKSLSHLYFSFNANTNVQEF